jgi:6-phosphogluconolactonase/glucosamine-6-phosphate isomerase/deaminase
MHLYISVMTAPSQQHVSNIPRGSQQHAGSITTTSQQYCRKITALAGCSADGHTVSNAPDLF